MPTIPVQGGPDALRCPRDGSTLVPFTIADITVDSCRACGGRWLDATELARVTHDEELEAMATRLAGHARRSPFSCPRCGGACYANHVEQVEVDACGDCRGVWLDADELREARRQVILQRATGVAQLRQLLAQMAPDTVP